MNEIASLIFLSKSKRDLANSAKSFLHSTIQPTLNKPQTYQIEMKSKKVRNLDSLANRAEPWTLVNSLSFSLFKICGQALQSQTENQLAERYRIFVPIIESVI